MISYLLYYVSPLGLDSMYRDEKTLFLTWDMCGFLMQEPFLPPLPEGKVTITSHKVFSGQAV